MKLFTLLATLVALTSAGHVFNQVPSEVYQVMGYHQAQDNQQSHEFGHGFDGGFQGHQVVQNVQHQPVQHQNIQTHHIQASPQHHIQFQSQPQHDHIHNQQVNFQGHSDQGSHIGQLSSHSSDSQQNSGENNYNKQAKILNYQHDFDEHNYQYAYETENGIKAQEVGTTSGEGTRAQGAYSYTGDDGQVYTVTYTADENGFHPSGAHLPTPPPIPEAIARSIEHNLRNEANGIVDDGHYHHQYDHDQNIQQSQQHNQKQQPSHGLFQQLQRYNYEQSHQQQPSTIVQQQVQQQQPEQQQQPKQQQKLPTLNLFQPLKQQNVIQLEPQKIVQQVQLQNQGVQSNVNQQQQSLNQVQHLQRQQKRIRLQQQLGSVLQRPHAVMQQQILPHVEEHRHVEYVIPTFTGNVRHQRTDDYVGPAPAPVTEAQY